MCGDALRGDPQQRWLTNRRYRNGWQTLILAGGLVMLSLPGARAQNSPATTGDSSANPVAAEAAALPKLADLALPSAEELLRGKPRDWIVLLNQDVIIVEPVSPRPNTLAILKSELEKIQKTRPSEIGFEVRQQKLFELARLQVTLLDNSVDPDYLLETRFIERIVYFEDLLLQRASKLLDEKQFLLAFDLLAYVEVRARNWPGFETQQQRFFWIEAEDLASRGEWERALVTLEQLHAVAPAYPRLFDQLGRVVHQLITAALDQVDPRRARHFLSRLSAREPQHPIAVQWRDRLASLANEQLALGRRAFAASQWADAARHVTAAAWIWPTLPGLKEHHQRMTDRYQVLRVGVWGPPARSSDARWSTSAARSEALTSIPLFEPDRIVDGSLRYRSAFLEDWEPLDLGRELEFRLRLRRPDRDSRPILSAMQIVDALEARLQPGSPHFDERWAADVLGLEALGPQRWKLTLQRPILRPEAWLRTPVPLNELARGYNRDLLPEVFLEPGSQRFVRSTDGRSEALNATLRAVLTTRGNRSGGDALTTDRVAASGMTATAAKNAVPARGTGSVSETLPSLLEGRPVSAQEPANRAEAASPTGSVRSSVDRPSPSGTAAVDATPEGERSSVTFRRGRPEPVTAKSRHVAAIDERTYPDWDRALQGLLRGEIDLVPVIEPRDVPALQQDSRFFVVPYAVPVAHVIVIHPQSLIARHTPLRRGLLQALPREQFVRDIVIGNRPAGFARVINTAVPRELATYPPSLSVLPDEPALAMALLVTARKELKRDLPTFTLAASDDPVAQRVLPAMLAAWKRLGIDVQLVDPQQTPAPDLSYQTVRHLEPLVDLWPLLSPTSKPEIAALDPFPQALREQFLQLDRQIDWTLATRALHRLQLELWAEARWWPLWSVDEFLVVRRHVLGVPGRLMHAYDGVDHWTIQAPLPVEPP